MGYGLLLHGVHARQAANPRLVKLYRRRLLFPAFLCRDYGFEAFLKAFLEIFQINVIAHGILSLSWFFLEDGERTIRHGDPHHH